MHLKKVITSIFVLCGAACSVAPTDAVVSESAELSQGSCGPRAKPWLVVPDSLNAGVLCSAAGAIITVPSVGHSADFGAVCTHHDRCYWLLGSDRGQCDATFRAEARDACNRAYKTLLDAPARECCDAFAEAYAAAVRGGGQQAWVDGQNDARTAGDKYTAISGYAIDATFIDMIATDCLENVAGENCDTDKVASLLVAEQKRIDDLYADYMDAKPGEAELKELLAKYWFAGRDLEPAKSLIVDRHGPEIVNRQVMKIAGLTPTPDQQTALVAVLRGYGIAYLKDQILINYSKDIVAKLYMEVKGVPIPFLWSQYYERMLLQKKDIEYVRQQMEHQRS